MTPMSNELIIHDGDGDDEEDRVSLEDDERHLLKFWVGNVALTMVTMGYTQ